MKEEKIINLERLGEIRMTAGVFESYQSDIDFSFFVDNCLERYLSGDWGGLGRR